MIRASAGPRTRLVHAFGTRRHPPVLSRHPLEFAASHAVQPLLEPIAIIVHSAHLETPTGSDHSLLPATVAVPDSLDVLRTERLWQQLLPWSPRQRRGVAMVTRIANRECTLDIYS
jgi:hypothetical protein